MTRKFLCFVLCCLWCFAGCGSNNERKITFSVGGAPAELNFWESLVKEFTQQTGIPVTLLRQPADTDQRRQGLVIPLEARKSSPDVFLMDVAWIAQFAASGWLEPLTAYAARDHINLQAFFPNVLDLADRYKGSLIALPVYVDAGLLYYRTDLLRRRNIFEPPVTWDQLVQYSLEIQQEMRPKRPNFSGFVWQGAQYEGLVCTFLEFAESAGGGIRLVDGKIIVDTPENLKAAKFMYDLIYRYRVSPLSTYTEMREEEVRMAFQQGNALFERNWPYAWALHQSSESAVKGRTGIAALPHFPGGKSVSTLGGWHIGISIYSQKKPSSWQLLKFLVSYPVQKRLVLGLGWNPGRKDLYTDSDVLSKLPHLARLRNVFENAIPRPMVPYYAQLSEVLQRHINAILARKSSPQVALAAAQREAQKLVDRYQEE
jgi:multiple sugar transport system substrate-binding protein